MTILTGDCIEMMRGLADESVHCCVTSPPYYGLRDYGHPGQIGLEESPSEFIVRLVGVFDEVRRVLRDDGVLWVNLGDSYLGPRPGARDPDRWPKQSSNDHVPSRRRSHNATGLPAKSLIGIPWRFAFAMQDAGWILRQDIIWHKPNPMPESVTDRCTKAHEYIFMFTKRGDYFFDHEAIKEPASSSSLSRLSQAGLSEQVGSDRVPGKLNGNMKAVGCDGGKRNRRSVWSVTTKPFKGAHFATFPTDLIEPCIASSTSQHGCCAGCGASYERVIEKGEPNLEHQRASGGNALGQYDGAATKDFASTGAQDASAAKARILAGMVERKTVGWQKTCSCSTDEVARCTVLDPFGGAGTTGLVADRLGCEFVLCEINPDYVRIAEERITADRQEREDAKAAVHPDLFEGAAA